MKLAKELSAVGYLKDAEDFKELLANVFANMFAGWTDEDVICRPDDAKRFCLTIRQATGCPDLCDYVILRSLTNCRKNCEIV